MRKRKWILTSLPVLLIVLSVADTYSTSLQSVREISSKGIVIDTLCVAADYSTSIMTNKLLLGVQIDDEIDSWVSSPFLRDRLVTSRLKLVRVFVTKTLEPCVIWDEKTNAGAYDWTRFDTVITQICRSAAEPMLCLDLVPDGMYVDPQTRLPDNESFARYAEDVATHVKNKGWEIRFWEILNEPQHTVISHWEDVEELDTFVSFFNIVAEHIHMVLPAAQCGTDSSNVKPIFDYFLQHASGVGFLSFHKYDAAGTWLAYPEGYLTDSEILQKAGQGYSYPYEYGSEEMREKWKSVRGQYLPIICSETNLNGQFQNGTDPRIQQPIGAVWYAEELRSFVSSGVDYSVYYSFASDDSPSWNTTKQTKGAGFGMVNSTFPHSEWYPYWTNFLIVRNLDAGDNVTFSSSQDQTILTTLAWNKADQHYLLLICKLGSLLRVSVNLTGVVIDPETQISIARIDSKGVGLQTETMICRENFELTMNGYSVLLLSF
jgi:hypothetical protein